MTSLGAARRDAFKATMQRIADALNVNQYTVSKDLEGLLATNKPSRPQRRARPKSSTKKPRNRKDESYNAPYMSLEALWIARERRKTPFA